MPLWGMFGSRLKPTGLLIAGAALSLTVTIGYAGFTLSSVQRSRELQVGTIDRNRKASLQLIRIQSDLNALALAMRDMLESRDGYPLTAWRGQLERTRDNLADAIRLEATLSATFRNAEQAGYLRASFDEFWQGTVDMMNRAASADETGARRIIRERLQPRQEALSALTARLLITNNEEEEKAAAGVNAIYDRLERDAWIFLALSLTLITVISIVLIRANGVMFARLAELSDQRRDLAQQLIATQESTLRSVSRDLHDEFGQILTALGAMLQRANRLAPDAGFARQIGETQEVVQHTLDRIRGLSQSLAPVIVEEQGLESAIPWQLSLFERQTGIPIRQENLGGMPEMESSAAVHFFRILQEALNNVTKHASASEVRVRTGRDGKKVILEVEDNGVGFRENVSRGVGLVGMRERAAILNGTLTIGPREGGGTRVRLEVPLG